VIADPLHVVGDVGEGAEDLVLPPVAGQVGELTSSNQFVVSGLQGTWWPRVLAGEKTMPAKVIRELIDERRHGGLCDVGSRTRESYRAGHTGTPADCDARPSLMSALNSLTRTPTRRSVANAESSAQAESVSVFQRGRARRFVVFRGDAYISRPSPDTKNTQTGEVAYGG